MWQNNNLNALHLTHTRIRRGNDRQLNLAPRLMRKITRQNDPATDQYFIQLENLILARTHDDALSIRYGETITTALNRFLENIDVPERVVRAAGLIRVVQLDPEDRVAFPGLRGGGKKKKTKRKRKVKSRRKIKSRRNK